HGGGHEHDLEEEVGGFGVDCAAFETVFTAGKLAEHGGGIHIRDTAQERCATVHDGVTTHHVHGAGDGIQSKVLGQDFRGVLGSDETGFEHRKAGGHPHD